MADLSDTLKDANGDFSSKRMAVAFAMANLAAMAWVGQLTTHQPSMDVIYAWAFIALGGLGLTVPEWFASKRPS